MLPQTWADLASALLPGLQVIYAGGGVPAWLALAMAGNECGIPVVADSTFAIENNPWSVRPHAGENWPSYDGGNGLFILYPDLTTACRDLLAALGPQRLQYAGDPAAFMSNLQATGWDGNPPASDGYAAAVLALGPQAQAALAALGVDATTGLAPGQPPPRVPVAAAAVPRGALVGIAAVVAAIEFGLYEAAVAYLRRLRGAPPPAAPTQEAT